MVQTVHLESQPSPTTSPSGAGTGTAISASSAVDCPVTDVTGSASFGSCVRTDQKYQLLQFKMEWCKYNSLF